MHKVLHAGDVFDLCYRCEQLHVLSLRSTLEQRKRRNLMGDSVDETAIH